MDRVCFLTMAACVTLCGAFTNSKTAYVKETAEEHQNPDIVGYTAHMDIPDFHFRRIGTTSAATEFAQVTVKFDLNKLHRHIRSVSVIVRVTAAEAPTHPGHEVHMLRQLDEELEALDERVDYLKQLVGRSHHQAAFRQKRFAFTINTG